MNVTRVGTGRYRVESESVRGMSYSVQVAGERGACDCPGDLGAHRVGKACKHVRAAIEAEKEYPMTTETTAITKADYVPVEYQPSWPSMDELKVITTMANHFYKLSGKMIPASIKSSEEAFAVMIAGREWGLAPMESFANMHVINGTVAPGYRVLAGAVMRGDPGAIFAWECEPDCKRHAEGKHLERSATRACARLTRSNGASIEVEYTIEEAKRAGLTGKDNWQKYPTDMLCAKVVTRACRLGGADLITRINASVRGAPAVMRAIEDAIEEEADDMPELEVRDVSNEPFTDPEPAARAQVQNFLREARETWDAESHRALLVAFNAAFPGKLNAKGDLWIGKGTEEEGPVMLAWVRSYAGEQQPKQAEMAT